MASALPKSLLRSFLRGILITTHYNQSQSFFMIDNLRKQDRDTILEFLQQLGNNPQLYVKHIVGLGPLIQDNDVYLFANDNEIVIVSLDTADGSENELADEEPFNDERPLYFSEKSHRPSPVWGLSVGCELVRHRLAQLSNHIPHVWGVLLTRSNLLNYEDMTSVWNTLNVSVFHRLGSRLKLAVSDSTDDELPMAFALQFACDAEYEDSDIVKAERCLRQLMSDAYNTADAVDTDDENEEDDTIPDWLKNFTLDDDDIGERMLAGKPKPEEPEPHTGIIQQNNNTQVKVKVLKPLSNAREELNELVGCNSIKKRMDELVNMTRYNQLMRRYNPGGKEHKLSQHCLFFGRPGTGKSTVARILGSLLRDAGALSKGHVVVCNRGTFVGNSWGDEERSVNQVVEMARGGVLMIDEAYLLSTSHPNDPGKLVIQLLMDLLADENDRDLAVVLCGYKEEMLKLLSLNSGLDSRFPNRFEFADFSVDQLMEITRRRVREYGYHFTRTAWLKLRQVVTEAYDSRDEHNWGNARFIANLLEQIYTRHAGRCVKLRHPDRAHLFSLTLADIVSPEVSKEPVKKEPARIRIAGFCK